jgi:dolichol kinase
MIEVLAVATAYLVLFVLVEVYAKKTKANSETTRKFVHIVAGSTAALLPLIMTFHQIAVVSLLFITVMLVSKRQNFFSSIHKVTRKTHGEIYFPFAILITALLFPTTELYMYGLLIMAVSDGLASIVGQKYGHKTYRFLGAHKSYIGSIAFFISATVIGLIILTSFTSLGVAPILIGSVLLAFILTVVEAGLAHGLDNLLLPPVSALLLSIFLTYFG